MSKNLQNYISTFNMVIYNSYGYEKPRKENYYKNHTKWIKKGIYDARNIWDETKFYLFGK